MKPIRARVRPACACALLLADDFAGLPPALVVTAGFDLLRDEGEAYADALSRAGVNVRARRFDALAHGFVNMTSVAPSACAATVEVARDWRALLDEIRREWPV